MIRLAIRERPSTATTAVFSPDRLSQQKPTEGRILKYVEDALQLISKGRAGLTVATKNEPQLRIWRQTVLKMALDAVKDQRPPDIYTIWLKPIDNDPDILVPYLSENFPAYDEHYKFGRREGLAGNVWALGQAAIHSQTLPHPKWTIRAGCDNASYIAVPVGEAGGVGGVLAVGSDRGFEPTEDDVRVLRLYAAVLAVSV
jgi:hypothetical protein